VEYNNVIFHPLNDVKITTLVIYLLVYHPATGRGSSPTGRRGAAAT
jgi:hypothetical protein